MPAVKYWEVKQTRSVIVRAANEAEAAVTATKAFNGEDLEPRALAAGSEVEVVNLSISQEL